MISYRSLLYNTTVLYDYNSVTLLSRSHAERCVDTQGFAYLIIVVRTIAI